MAFLDTIGEFVGGRASQTGGWLAHYAGVAFSAPFKAIGLVDADGNLVGAADLIGAALADPNIPPTLRDSLQRMAADRGFVSQVYATLVAGSVQVLGILAELRPILSLSEQAANADVRPNLLTPEVLMELFRRSLETEGNIDAELQALGYRDVDIANFKALTKPLLDVDMVRNLYWRGTITPTVADDLLSRLGYDETQRHDITSLFAALPSVDDHIRMAVRQVFNPELRQALGLDEDYPTALTANIAKVGLSEEWARNIWAAHWQVPSPTQIFDMVFRGVIDDNLMNQALRDAGYSPLWRDKLLQINQRLVTRVDGRRLFDTGVWDEARLERHFRQLGYAQQDAADLALWTVRNATEGDQLRKSRVKSLTEQMVIHGLETFVIHADTAREMLQGLNYTAEEIELLVSAAEYRRDAATVKEVETALKQQYVRGQMERSAVVDQLAGIGLDSARIGRLLGAWDLLRQSLYLTEHAHHAREVTKGDVVTFYEDNTITRQVATQSLLDIGYPQPEVDLLIANADVKIAKTVKKDHLDTIHYQFVNGQIDQLQASTQLDGMNLRGGERDYLLAKWLHEAHRGTTNLTVQQLGGLFATGIVNTNQVRAELSSMGYSTQHVDWLARSIVGTHKVDTRGFVTPAV